MTFYYQTERVAKSAQTMLLSRKSRGAWKPTQNQKQQQTIGQNQSIGRDGKARNKTHRINVAGVDTSKDELYDSYLSMDKREWGYHYWASKQRY